MLLERRLRPVRGLRVVRRPGAPFRVQIVPTRRVNATDIERLLATLEPPDSGDDGMVVTSALSPTEQRPFLAAGFELFEELHLLRHPLEPPLAVRSDATIRSGRRSDLETVLALDAESFDAFWALDRAGITAARRATTSHRYAVATLGGMIAGYAIVGAAGSTSFLQRLAVRPEHRGRRIGAHLVSDAIEWARRRHTASMLVNTQITNDHAFGLYQRLGFEVDRDRLAVLRWPG